ncbi:MAG TPA: LamG-like jellyroll fold domain-containing protein, partial [Luteolibacter sp.]|nr:LamG-like jellyroll fold domain-containing protein [Luteolibacter sp.]
DYYVAATVNFTGTTVETVFYIQNITDSGALISMNGTPATLPAGYSALPTSLYNSTANFAIGASYATGSPSRYYDGLIDEVRLSDTVLSPSQLLAVPETSSAGLIAAAALLLGTGRRRVR